MHLVDKGRNPLKEKSRELGKRADSIKKKTMPIEIGSAKKTSPTSSITKIAVKSGKGALHTMQTEKSTEKLAPNSPKTWKASSLANYKISASLASPRSSIGGLPEDNKQSGKISGSLKTGKPSSPIPGEAGKAFRGSKGLKGTK